MNLRWPATPDNALRPWYAILWAACWAPLVLLGVALASIGVWLMTLSLSEARRLWREIM